MLNRKKVIQVWTNSGGKMLPNVALPSTPSKHIKGCSFSAIKVCARFHQFIVSTLNINCLLLFNFQHRVNSHGKLSTIVTFWSAFSYLICGNKMPTRCNRWFLLQILLPAQHVSGTIMPIIRSSRVCGLQPANRTHNLQLHTIPTTWKPKHQIPQAVTICIILSSSWW